MKKIFQINFLTLNVFLFCIVLFLFILLFSGCDDIGTEYEPPENISLIRILHQSAGGEELDFSYEWLHSGDEFGLIYGMEYEEQYGYYSFESEPLIIRAYYHNTNIVAASDTLELKGDKAYSIFANDMNASINPELLTFDDTTENPRSGKILLRFINLGADIDLIDVSLTDGEPVVNSLNKYEASRYIELNEGTYQFNIYNYDSLILQTSPVTFNKDLVYTAVFSGSVSGMLDTPFNSKVFQDINN